MKRKDFLRQMRNRRRRDQLELREPEQRRAIDWRTLRFALPATGEHTEQLPIGSLTLLSTGVRLVADQPCWVRGYRVWHDEEGNGKAEFQYRPTREGVTPPTGTHGLAPGETWEPSA